MFFPEGRVRIFVYGQPVDMRRSFDGLTAIVSKGFGRDVMTGDMYAFINRRATQIKVIYFDRTGLCIWSKRLEQGRLIADWSKVKTREMEWTGLKMMLEGIEPKRTFKRYRRAQRIDDGASDFAWR
jgi:transposase